MIIPHLFALLLVSTPAWGQAPPNNASPITGTWSSGSQAVITGPVRLHRFFRRSPSHHATRALPIQPMSRSHIPRQQEYHTLCANFSDAWLTSAHHLHSTDDGYYEIARYRFNSNGRQFSFLHTLSFSVHAQDHNQPA
jgi:hypothetical protein